MAFDGLITKSICTELQQNIIGCKINKIYQPSPQDIILDLYGNKKRYQLLICTNGNYARTHLTKYEKENPITAPNFCMFLRKHLNGAKMLSIQNFDLERVIEITWETYNEMKDKIVKKLIIEIMGQFSNVLLVNESGTILDCLKHVVTKTRELLPVRPYTLPENTKHSFLSLPNFESFMDIWESDSSAPLDQFFSTHFIGISRPEIQNLCRNLSVSLDTQKTDELQKIYDYLKDLLVHIENSQVNCVLGQPKGYYLAIDQSGSSTSLAVNQFLDEYYHQQEEETLLISYRNKLLKSILGILEKYNRRLANIDKKIKECSHMDTYKLYGELLTSNLYQIKHKTDHITVFNYYNNENVEIPLDSSLSPSQNVDRYYKKYNKCRNGLAIIQKQKEDTIQELEYMEGLVDYIKNCQEFSLLKKVHDEFYALPVSEGNKNTNHQSPKSMPKKYIINGFTVYVGKNNKQNDSLTRSANKEDLWFHTQKIHGSHVILKTEGREVDFNTILQCAKLAAQNSKAKHSSNIPVDYTYVKYVRKPAGSKPGFAVYVNYKTVFVN